MKRRRAIVPTADQPRAKPLREPGVCLPLPADASTNASSETPLPFDATDERFIRFLVEAALKEWRSKIS